MLVIVIAVLFGNRSQFDFSCHVMIISYLIEMWYNKRWKGGRVVDGTGLENQQINVSQVRILSLPPNNRQSWHFFLLARRLDALRKKKIPILAIIKTRMALCMGEFIA